MTWDKALSKTYYDVKNSSKRILINQGGTRSGKTYSILQLLIELAFVNRNSRGLLFSIIRKTVPALKKSVYRDFLHILQNSNIPYRENKTDHTIYVFTSTFEFIGLDNPQKIRGAKRDIAFLNEANECSLEDFRQIALRTTGNIILDYNPSEEFWVHTELLEHRKEQEGDVDFFVTNYKHNPFLPEATIKEIEQYKDRDPNYWKIYGLGQLGQVEGLVYPNFHIVDSWPEHIEYFGYGLDFGYSHDPTALIKVAIKDDQLFLQELVYQTGLLTSDLIDLMRQLRVPRNRLIVADSARPDSIEEIRRAGFLVQGVSKAPLSTSQGSLEGGIDLVRQLKINLTAGSVNTRKEFRNYRHVFDSKRGKYLNVPADAFNHAMDALRYYVLDHHRRPRAKRILI